MLFQAKKRLIVSFYEAWRVRISITTQYNNIYVIIEQFMTLAEPVASFLGNKRDQSPAFGWY